MSAKERVDAGGRNGLSHRDADLRQSLNDVACRIRPGETGIVAELLRATDTFAIVG